MYIDRLNHVARRLLGPFAIDPITPLALAVFRATFGLGLLYMLLVYEPIRAKAFDLRQPHGPFADAEWVYALATNHTAASAFQFLACAAAILFILGVFARAAYVVVVSMMFIHVLMILTRVSAHDWDLPIVTLIAMTIVPWGEAPPVWTLRHSWRALGARRLASQACGFAVWFPGLMVGLAFAAAAYAKVGRTGIQWITNGTVRYHFVEDGRNAPITLGLWIAAHTELSIFLSLIAVLAEAVFVLIVFARGWRVRLAFGLMGASMMAGFTLLQNVAWWPWRILFLAFLPWTLLKSSDETVVAAPDRAGGGATVAQPRDLTWVHGALVFSLIGVQVWASWKKVELEPVISNFPMYAYTWSSPEEFNRRQARTRFEADGVDISDRIEYANGESLLRDMATFQSVTAHQEPDPNDVRRFTDAYRRTYGTLPSTVDVFVVQRPFDFQQGRYLPQTREHLGTVQLPP